MARREKPPSFQLYPRDLLFDTSGMRNEELGAYLRLLLHAWDPPLDANGEKPPIGHLPNESDLLARKSETHERWPEVSAAVLRLFRTSEDGRFLIQKRMVEERKKQRQYSKSMSENGKLGGRPKKQKPNQTEAGKKLRLFSDKAGESTASASSSASSSPGSIEPGGAAGAASSPPAKQGKLRSEPFVHPELGKPNNAKQRKVVERHLAACRHVIDAVNAGRKRVNGQCRGISASYTSLAEIAGRLDSGKTVEDCLHVVAICEAESKANPEKSFPYFNTISPFIAKNFERLAARDIESAGRAPPPPDRFQRPDAPRPPPPEFTAPERPSVPDDPEARRRVLELAKGAA
mgnify:CR=1 FL=1